MSDDVTSGSNRVVDLINGLLDRGYSQTAEPVLRAIARDTNSGIVQQRLDELRDEAQRLQEAGERLQPDNPVLRALIADSEPVFGRAANRMDAVSGDIAVNAADTAGRLQRQLTLPGMTDARLRAIGIQWNTPDPEAINALVDYTGRDEWRALVERYPGAISDTIRSQAIQGMANGWGPLFTAGRIVETTTGLPEYQANVLMRTLQLESYRSASALHQTANADILEGSIRIGTLDDRICLCCLSLHGSRLRVGEKVADHHGGRCTSVGVVTGRPLDVLSGGAWFEAQSEPRKRQLMGPANYEAYKAGRVQLRDFVQDYRDPVFGDMVRQASLSSVLGSAAKEYYTRR